MNRPVARAGWMYRKVLRHALLDAFLHHSAGLHGGTVFAGWGLKASGRAAIRAAGTGGKLLLMEDAFVRSLKPGPVPMYGLLADSQGIHYDATGKSDLIEALETGKPCGWMTREKIRPTEVSALMERFRQTAISKYNWFSGEYDDPPELEPGILVVDQTLGDAALKRGGVQPGDFDRMLRDAFEESEGIPVYLRGHPDHLHRAKKSCFSAGLLADKRIRLLSPDLPPAWCFPICPTVMVGSSLMGMEALMHGCRVVTYGVPFYAGWGLTEDRARNFEGRKKQTALADLFEMAYLRYCHYFDPDTTEPCGLGRIFDHIALQKEMFRRNRGLQISVGLNPWKKRMLAAYLRSPAGKVKHVAGFPDVRAIRGEKSARLLVWGRKQERPAHLHQTMARAEDGFIRSRGLGAAFNFPYSCVVDDRGIYFDPTRPSDLEQMLENGFSDPQLADARALMDSLRKSRLTKYNIEGGEIHLDRKETAGKKVILVPGQVDGDASILFGSPEVTGNRALIRRVREENPDAYLVYKVHPDIAAAVRHGAMVPEEERGLCDLVVMGGNVLDWLEVCDEVHTMTSTVGFEALIREVSVTTFGMPFYAGWGLTRDHIKCPRRIRRLTLEELVCGALICYPRYLNPATGEFTTAANVVKLLAAAQVPVDTRAWYLRSLVWLKKRWVKARRNQ